jgi:hypothetical protein
MLHLLITSRILASQTMGRRLATDDTVSSNDDAQTRDSGGRLDCPNGSFDRARWRAITCIDNHHEYSTTTRANSREDYVTS